MKPQILYLLIACILMLGGCSRCRKDDPKCSDIDSLNCTVVPYCHINGVVWRTAPQQSSDSISYEREPGSLMVGYLYTLRLEGNHTGAQIHVGSDARTFKDSAVLEFDRPYANIPVTVKAWRDHDRCGLPKADTIQFTTNIQVDTANEWRFDGYYRGTENLGRQRLVQIQHTGGPVDGYGCNQQLIFRNLYLGLDSAFLGLSCQFTRQAGAFAQGSKYALWMNYRSGYGAWMHFSGDSLHAKIYRTNPFQGHIEYLRAKKIN